MFSMDVLRDSGSVSIVEGGAASETVDAEVTFALPTDLSILPATELPCFTFGDGERARVSCGPAGEGDLAEVE